ncbi:kinase-like domain-containing protein [Mycena filopes]|nr:kinase-like domain-containing protein [Mycena filopes]
MEDQKPQVDRKYSKLLYEDENFWVDCQPFLLAHGYQLRPRYRPDWVPSWLGPSGNSSKGHEDKIRIQFTWVIDATRVSDGKQVVLKHVLNAETEMQIIEHLNSPSARADPRNRTIPLLDIITTPGSPGSFLVMPRCREFTYPPFHCRNEFVEAMTQYMEGLQFMHDHNIAHFDIAPKNMVMDESRVIPNGSHFGHPRTHTGFYGVFSWKDRCSVAPVDYYFIDFDLSSYHPEGKDTARRCQTLRTFRSIPELSDTIPFNPFPVDIFQLGLTLQELIDAYPALEEFRAVANTMTATDPAARPTAGNAAAQLRTIATSMSPSKLSERIWTKDTGLWKKLTRAVIGGYLNDYMPWPAL